MKCYLLIEGWNGGKEITLAAYKTKTQALKGVNDYDNSAHAHEGFFIKELPMYGFIGKPKSKSVKKKGMK